MEAGSDGGRAALRHECVACRSDATRPATSVVVPGEKGDSDEFAAFLSSLAVVGGA
jgi:hypothetical protein